MKHFFQKISIKPIEYISFFVSLSIGVAFLLSIFEYYLIGESPNTVEKILHNGFKYFFTIVFIYPAIETFIFQWLVYKIIGSYTDNRFFIILTSATFYSLIYITDIDKVITAFLHSIIFMTAFINWSGKSISKFKITTIIHILSTLILLLIVIFSIKSK